MGVTIKVLRSNEDIEKKKYPKKELLRLLLFDNFYYYPPEKYIPDKICKICQKNPVTKQYQFSRKDYCLNCYNLSKNLYYEEIKQSIQAKQFIFEGNCIIPNKLYLGSLESSYCKDKLKELGITHILMTCYFVIPIFPDDFVYENIEVDDYKSENILQYLIKGIKFIEQSKICYVHCQYGISRSASFVIAYIMYKKRIHFPNAFLTVQNKRKKIYPNEGFQCQLSDFDLILYNFDYNLDKCDNFIKNYFENREILEKKEKEYLNMRFA